MRYNLTQKSGPDHNPSFEVEAVYQNTVIGTGKGKNRKIAEQAVIINNAQQTAAVGQMITQATTPIYQAVGALHGEVDKIKCKLPETFPVQYQPFVAVPNCVAAQYGLGGGVGLGQGGFWY